MIRPADQNPWADKKARDLAHKLFPKLLDVESPLSRIVSERLDQAGDADGLDLIRLAVEADRELRELSDQIVWNCEMEASKKLARTTYPQVLDQDSREFALTIEINRELEANGNPLFWSSQKPFILAALAARQSAES